MRAPKPKTLGYYNTTLDYYTLNNLNPHHPPLWLVLCFNEWRVHGYGTTLVGVGWRKEGEIKDRSGKGEEGNDKRVRKPKKRHIPSLLARNN